MKIFLLTILLTVSSLIDAQITKKTNLIKGLPANSFYNKFRNSSKLYSYAELNDTQESASCVLLLRQMKDSTTSFYLVYNKTESDIKIDEISQLIHSNSSSVSFPIELNERNFILEFNSNVIDSIKFRYKKQIESTIYIPTELRTHLDLECVTMNKNYQEHIGSSQYPPAYSEYSKLSTNFLFGFGFALRINDKHELILRPAFAVYENPFQGLELGFFYRYYLRENFFGYIGYVGHSGTEGAHGTYNYQDGSGGFFINFGLGYGFLENLAVLVNYSSVSHINAVSNSLTYKLLKDQYGKEYIGNISTRKNWDWLLSIGIEFNY